MPEPKAAPDAAPARNITISIPTALLGAIVTIALGGSASAAGGMITREGDLTAVKQEIAATAEQLQAQESAWRTFHVDAESKTNAALEQRLDRIEAKLDRLIEQR